MHFKPAGAVAHVNAVFGEGVGPILLQSVRCNGLESSLANCSSYNSYSNCFHYHDAGVSCLQGKQIYRYIAFRPIKSPYLFTRYWTHLNSGVSLGILNICHRDVFHDPNLKFFLINQDFFGAELNNYIDQKRLGGLSITSLRSLSVFNAWFTMYVGCTEGEIRLRGGFVDSEGRVEICLSNEWGTVCDQSWDNTDAGVVCRQLGYGTIGTNKPLTIHACLNECYTIIRC